MILYAEEKNTPINMEILLRAENISSLLYLALVGNAVCYLLWGNAVKYIGVLEANLYIYMVPIITLLVSAVILKEPVTAIGFLGILLVIIGMILGTISKDNVSKTDESLPL